MVYTVEVSSWNRNVLWPSVNLVQGSLFKEDMYNSISSYINNFVYNTSKNKTLCFPLDVTHEFIWFIFVGSHFWIPFYYYWRWIPQNIIMYLNPTFEKNKWITFYCRWIPFPKGVRTYAACISPLMFSIISLQYSHCWEHLVCKREWSIIYGWAQYMLVLVVVTRFRISKTCKFSSTWQHNI